MKESAHLILSIFSNHLSKTLSLHIKSIYTAALKGNTLKAAYNFFLKTHKTNNDRQNKENPKLKKIPTAHQTATKHNKTWAVCTQKTNLNQGRRLKAFLYTVFTCLLKGGRERVRQASSERQLWCQHPEGPFPGDASARDDTWRRHSLKILLVRKIPDGKDIPSFQLFWF